MTVISMLRGINVGGNRIIKMDALRAVYESLGLQSPTTFIQSGNVVFRTREKNMTALTKRIEDAIEKTFGFRADVLCRTAAEMRAVLDRNPFADRPEIDGRKLLVVFLSSKLEKHECDTLHAIPAGLEELRATESELFIHYDNMARPQLSMSKVEKSHGRRWTGRNLNTVRKLLELAEE